MIPKEKRLKGGTGKGKSLFGLCTDGQNVYIFGGESESTGNAQLYNDLWIVYVNKMHYKFEKINVKGIKPHKRYQNSLDYYKHNLYTFGGYTDIYSDEYAQDMWKYSIKDKKWYEIKCQYKPSKRSYHRTVVYRHYIIMFGGLCYVNNNSIPEFESYNDINIFNMKTNKWKYIECNNAPIARRSHGMMLSNENVIIYGGRDRHDNILNDISVINADNIIQDNCPYWTKIENNMSGLFAFTMINYNNNFVIFGGKYDDIRTNKLIVSHNLSQIIGGYNISMFISKYIRDIELKYLLHIPKVVSIFIENCVGFIKNIIAFEDITPRAGHNGDLIHINNKPYLFIYGGFDGFLNLNDSFLINLQTLKIDKTIKEMQ